MTEKQNDIAVFFNYFEEAILGDYFVKLTLSKPISKAQLLKNIYIRPVLIRNEYHLSFLYRYTTRDEVKNYLPEDAFKEVELYLSNQFFIANLITLKADFQLKINKKRKTYLQKLAPSHEKLPPVNHDKQKSRFIEATNNPYLQALGITNKQGEVLKQGQKKYKQINKYIEILDGLLQSKILPEQPNIVDMGSGKGYLTFALYDYMKHSLDLDPRINGIELRNKLVEQTEQLARSLNYDGLSFKAMNIFDYPLDQIDMIIALHACDIATDIAIAKGIQSDAKIIVVAPCCHKQVRNSMKTDGKQASVLKHGILMERQAEILTDTIRALIMEANGYKTKVFEFISSEHTSKNLMIIGQKDVERSDALEEVEHLKSLYDIEYHYLEKLLEKN
ncbi:MAG: SAM-dependent methyltransferase [Bacteroidota bacterium]